MLKPVKSNAPMQTLDNEVGFELENIYEDLYMLSLLWDETTEAARWVDMHEWIGRAMGEAAVKLYKIHHGNNFEMMVRPRTLVPVKP